jgi:hypothetical protein
MPSSLLWTLQHSSTLHVLLLRAGMLMSGKNLRVLVGMCARVRGRLLHAVGALQHF